MALANDPTFSTESPADARSSGALISRVDATSTAVLVALVVLPLLVILGQIALGMQGMLGNAIYKLTFLLGPLLYCRWQGIPIGAELLGFSRWRNGLRLAIGLGLLGIAIFWGAYFLWSDVLLDTKHLVEQFQRQFSVNSTTVLLIAPWTIILNSLLEEFFYRTFAFGQLVRRVRWLAWSLPAAVFTLQHVLFIRDWVGWVPMTLAVVSLLVFALVMQWLYARSQSIVAPWIAHVLGDVAMMGIAARMLGVV